MSFAEFRDWSSFIFAIVVVGVAVVWGCATLINWLRKGR